MTDVRNSATAEDQLQINKFARVHKSYLQTKEEITLLKNEICNLNDAADEILLLDDEDAASIPFLIGSIFVHHDQDTINEKMEKAKEEAEHRVSELEDQLRSLDGQLKELRAILYAKFGDNIHLEMESEDI